MYNFFSVENWQHTTEITSEEIFSIRPPLVNKHTTQLLSADRNTSIQLQTPNTFRLLALVGFKE
jgi:hypothetical protein